MKKIIKLIILFFICQYSLLNAQIASCQWARSAGGNFNDNGNAVTTDVSGNVFIVGSYDSPSMTIGTSTLTHSTLHDVNDIFIAKYSSSGALLWATSAGGTSDDIGLGIATDVSGNAFVSGYFSSPYITFGTFTLTNTSGSGGLYNFFIVKYSPTGAVLWANSSACTFDPEGLGISTDTNGNVYVAGSFAGTMNFGTNTLTTIGGGYSDIFIVKYSNSGTVLWASSAGGIDNEYAYGISTDVNGNAFITGHFLSPTIKFGTSTLTNVAPGEKDIFIVKYSSSGTVLWANSAGGLHNDESYGVSTDPSGNVLITGCFYSPDLAFGTTTLSNTWSCNIFITKYSPNGTVIWAISGKGTGGDKGNSITTDANGNVFATGYFGSSILTFGTSTLTNAGYWDVYIVKYSPSGTLLWISSASGLDTDIGSGICTDASGNVFVTGAYRSQTLSIETNTLTNTFPGYYDFFIAKLCYGVVGINENRLDPAGITIYPNPFTSQTTISFAQEQTDTRIRVIDILGKELQEISHFQGKEVILDRGTMATGIYFVQVLDKTKTVITEKIILH